MAAHRPSLPDDAVAEILARLPSRSIARFRAVCRAWNAITSHPIVDRVLAKRTAAVTMIVKESDDWFEVDDDDPHVDIVRIDRFRGRWHPDVHNTEPCPQALSLDDMTVSTVDFRSWDGVLCTRVFPRKPQPGASTDHYMLWNPLTDACVVVSTPTAGQGRIIGGYAHPVAGRFHLLHSSDVTVPGDRGLVAPITVRILGVGAGTGWREVPLPNKPRTISMKGKGDHSVSLHGNLHCLVQPDSGKVALLVFDTVTEKFRLMAAPERPGLDPTTARSRVVPGDKLCILALIQQPPVALEVWVLDDYSNPWSWRLREKIRMVRLDGANLSPRFVAAAAVEVVEGVKEGEEIFIHHLEHGIDAYSVRSKVWRKACVGRYCAALLMYRESVVQPEICFGEALRGFSRGRARGSRREWDQERYRTRDRSTSANIPLQWSDIKRV